MREILHGRVFQNSTQQKEAPRAARAVLFILDIGFRMRNRNDTFVYVHMHTSLSLVVAREFNHWLRDAERGG